ncbi:MAG: ABC transporter ATP-binding protein [Xanthobacteraceae bacterium]|nr:MAG: ABC transporter ATP-binding protein [Xanthobacteraceae bacterium]
MIRIEGLRKRFRGAVVVDGIDLAIPAGQRMALVGSNGAGKTTLIRCLLGEYHYEGRITVDGLSPHGDRAALLMRTAFVPQLPPPLRMPVSELVRFVARVSGVDPRAVAAIAERLSLPLEPIRSRAFNKLSGGQKQKLLVAIALARDVDFLILDEPAANLDPPARAALFDLMAERGDATMIISSHRIDEIAGLVNRVVELDRGRVALDDHVVETLAPDRLLRCEVRLGAQEPVFARAALDWGLQPDDSGLMWRGAIPAPDRLRFLGFLTRYSALIVAIRVEEHEHADASP